MEKVFKMKTKHRVWLLAIIALIGFGMAACDTGTTSTIYIPGPHLTGNVFFYTGAGGTPVHLQELSVGDRITRPADPTRNGIGTGLFHGSLPGAGPLVFEGWYHGNTPWDFDTPLTHLPLALTARWSDPRAIEDDLAAAITHANGNTGPFFFALDRDIDVTSLALTGTNTDLTLVGIGGQRQIRFATGVGRLFSVGPATGTDDTITLTLGANITLVGSWDSRTPGAAVGNDLVRVWNGANLVMLEGSVITGHANNSTAGASGMGAAVLVIGGGNFVMRGGEITGNRAAAVNAWANSHAGVRVESGTLRMEGGRIHGNVIGASLAAGQPADVFVVQGHNITVAGNARGDCARTS